MGSETLLLGGLGLVAVLIAVVIGLVSRQARESEEMRLKSAEAERYLADLMRTQAEMTGRMQTMA